MLRIELAGGQRAVHAVLQLEVDEAEVLLSGRLDPSVNL
jgi:hypothetical protein